ncbi:DUF222 domain-containing protein [Mycolicibacterium sp. P9-22]|uniref:DUF222 domain-containing protein n=1 Tax=Mycolicibacterium sp. P9-22 TaxID=2024613 RepID=UPI0011ED6D91|nr:DUF222 domain-containing protein [Mycolicibacterium sp. P9-22]KAA0110458.1 DUF222 domain-containing protein [Mycolicibacterium sp. P9-22]
MSSDVVGGREAVQHALSDRAASVKALLDADFTVYDTAELLGLLSEREQYARADAAVDHRILAALMDRATPHEIGGKTWKDVLATRDRISTAEAGRRIAGARDLGPRHALNGEVLEPLLAGCAAALANGSINTGHITVIRSALKQASRYLDATERAQMEATLVAVAETNTPETLAELAEQMVYVLNQNGDSPDLTRHKAGLTIGKPDVDGLSKVSGHVDSEFAAYLRTILDVWARPGINNPDDPQPQHNPEPNPLEEEPAAQPCADTEPAPDPGPAAEELPFPRDFAELADLADTLPPPITRDLEPPAGDHRSQPLRNHDAIKAVLRDTLMSKRLGQHNGLPVTVVVSTTLAELEAGAGIAVTGSGTRMPMRDLIRLAEHAHHYLIVYRHHTAEPLYMGRTKRLATKAQRLLLYHRDRGCTRPGCTQGACRCQAHHANPSWNNDGRTDAPDLGLGCGPDNLLAELGWTNTIDPTTGRVHWHPPPLMDTGGDTLNHHFHPEELLPPRGKPEDEDDGP